jgi:hypothetical protein
LILWLLIEFPLHETLERLDCIPTETVGASKITYFQSGELPG